MPVEQFYVDSMLDTYRNMLKDCIEKDWKGDHLESMKETLKRMEQLGQEKDDISEYTGALMQENLFLKFSDHYSKLIAQSYRSDYDPNAPYDDEADKKLMKISLNAYRDAIKRIREEKESSKKLSGENAGDVDVLFNDKRITDAIQAVIDLGESGICYAEWCRLLIERGLDKSMEGSVLSRENLVYQYEFAVASSADFYTVEAEKKKLELFDELCKRSKVGMADLFQFNLGCEKIDHIRDTLRTQWKFHKYKWEKLFDKLDHWIMAYTKHAPYMFPWNQHTFPAPLIKESQLCTPGEVKVYERMVKHYFDLDFTGIFRHPSFRWEIERGFFMYAQDYTFFILNEVYPQCAPNASPTPELIKKAEEFYSAKQIFRPEVHINWTAMKNHFDKYFGEGEYVRRYGPPPTRPETNAPAWDMSKFPF